MPNFYQILGVSEDASEGEIKKAYRTLSLKFHPDRNPSDEAKSRFQEINEAYENLGDPAKREQYNMELRFGGGGGGMPFTHMNSMDEFTDINNIFNMMFNGGMPGMPGMGGPGIRVFHGGMPGMNIHTQMFHQVPRPEPLIKNIQISLEQSYTGCNIPVDIERWCILNNVRSNEKEVIYLNIPQGIDNNDTLVIPEKGNNINNEIRSELRLTFQINNSTEFKRQGLDLVYNKKISLKEALCGFTFEILHLNGKRLCLNNSNNVTVIKPNFKKVIPNMGMTKDNSTGNMIIDFDVEFPDKLTPEQIESLNTTL